MWVLCQRRLGFTARGSSGAKLHANVAAARGGKAVLLAGASDTRIALTAPNCSGCGGAGCFRFEGPQSETIENITQSFPTIIALFAMQIDVPFILWVVLLMTLGNLLVFRGLKTGTLPAIPPLVSILVPARNEAHNIGPCVLSLLAQDYPNFEIIFGARQSIDPALKIVESLRRKYPHVPTQIVLSGEPAWPSPCRRWFYRPC